jgi:hypothetical protein
MVTKHLCIIFLDIQIGAEMDSSPTAVNSLVASDWKDIWSATKYYKYTCKKYR